MEDDLLASNGRYLNSAGKDRSGERVRGDGRCRRLFEGLLFRLPLCCSDEDLQLGLPCGQMVKPAVSFIRYASDSPAVLIVPIDEAAFISPLRSVPQPPLLVF